jgi:hypothetical protein
MSALRTDELRPFRFGLGLGLGYVRPFRFGSGLVTFDLHTRKQGPHSHVHTKSDRNLEVNLELGINDSIFVPILRAQH